TVIHVKWREISSWFERRSRSNLEYQRLHDEIQNWVKGVGDGGRCLAEMNGEWHRARVVSRAGDDYTVFTLDEGRATAVRGRGLERGKKDFFQLPPEAVCCILANLVGAKPTCWPPSALSFLRSLQGRELDGYVDAVLPNRLVLLDVPRVSRQLCESGLAKVIGRTAFRLLIGAGAAGTEPGPLALPPPPPPPPPPPAPPSDASYSLNYFYPLLQVDETVTVTVRVTHVRYPDRFFCQLRCHCPELERLHLSMHRYYESSRVSGTGTAPRKLGSPCAAKSLDGRWYRAVVQQTLSDRGVEVFLVDYGNKEVVSSCSIRKLSPGYFKMPVVTYPFALREASDYGRGWSAKQIELLHTLIINKVLQAKIEFYNSVENVYYVTLYREDGSTINAAFNAQVESVNYERVIGYCEDNELRGEYQKINALHCSGDYFTGDRRTEGLSKTKDRISYLSMLLGASLLKNANLKLNAFYDALVEFVKDPTEFWIRTMDTASEFEKLMNSIAKKYGPLGRNEGLVKKPEPGLLCCAKFKADHLYYRAVITEILDGQFRVFFIDYGNLELVDWHDVKALLPEYRKLPALAVKCCLADLVPKEATWSKEAIAYFEKVVFEKHLVVHVLDKEMDKYLIELLDVEDEGEPSVNKIMLQEGYADQKALKVSHFSSKTLFEERPITPEKFAPCMEYPCSTEDSNDCLATVLSNMPYKISSHGEIETGDTRTQNIAVMDSAITESPYKQEYLKVGSTVDVQVSYIDEPGDFWCQLTKNAHELKMLMSKIQEYYNTHADHSQPCQSACIAKYSEDGKWYRALILGKVSALEVDVLYVDYGNRERVSFSDLCAIRPEFLLLKGQAFRCSLYNIIQPMGSDPFMWNVDSVAAFQEFIDSALSLYMELKCTVYALTIVDGKGLCNVVDLNTPFQSACQLLIERGLAKFVGSPSVLAPSVNLYTYYYSTHDVKIGSEEEMYVSHVTSPTKFYCLLSRNLDIVDKLADKVNKLSCKLPDYKFSQGVDPICLAKYTDNQWYRALAWPIQDRIRVSFVDYGNKLDVDKDDLLPIPDSARDVKFLPMQAIKCGLSDIPAELSLDINTWFRKAVTDKPLKAVVVAKESDGKLIVELYDGNVQINAKIKEQLYLQGTSEAKTMNGNSGRQKIKSEKLCSTFMVKSDHEPSLLKRRIIEDQDEVHEAEKAAVSSHTQDRWKNRTEIFIVENVEAELKCAPNMDLKNVKEFSDVKSNVETRNNKSVKSNVEKTSFSKLGFDTSKLPLPKEIDIPLITLKPGFKCEARISHVVSPSHFFVHLSQHDDKVTMMEEKLNASWANDTEVECFQYESLQLGDMVCAESPEDGSHYRSVVTQKIANNLVGVEFIDYGNTVNVQPSKIHRLSKEAMEVQRLSVPCFISGVQDTLSTGYSIELVSAFKKRANGIMCEFIKLHGQLWEVQLCDDQGTVANLLEDTLCEQYTLNSQQESGCSITDIRPGSKLNAYVFAIKSPNQFWCQFMTTADGIFIESLQKAKGERCKMRSEDIMDLKVGNVCMVKSKGFLNWATCEIVDICNGGIEVVFMKEDSKELVNPEDVKEVTPAFALTYECKLHRLFPFNGSNWSQKAIEFFKTLVLYKRVLIKVINMSKPNILEVDIYVNLDNAVRDQLTASELAVEKDESNTTTYGRYIRKIPLVGQTIEGYVTAAESPSYFWCQYSASEIQMLAEKMQELGKREDTGTKLSSISVGDSCFCKYSEDEQFYRAEVKKTNSNILSLNYVDYGNEEDVEREQVRKLPEELLKIPVQAFPCCLSGYDLSEGSWKDGAVGDFLHLLSDQLLKITALKNDIFDSKNVFDSAS
uniref:Tudor domain containing 6 n=1 Tax=Callorhinchus milii TaxID=7868 RepID=A0A4W3HZ02_CALMI